jgi:hypothetical protein
MGRTSFSEDNGISEAPLTLKYEKAMAVIGNIRTFARYKNE